MYVHMCMLGDTAAKWRSESISWELILSFHHVVPTLPT